MATTYICPKCETEYKINLVFLKYLAKSKLYSIIYMINI